MDETRPATYAIKRLSAARGYGKLNMVAVWLACVHARTARSTASTEFVEGRSRVRVFWR